MIEEYIMVGIVNVFGVKPDFVLPVFKKGNSENLYVQMGENETITGMLEVDDDMAQRVLFFEDRSLFEHAGVSFSDSDPVYFFQTGKRVYIGNAKAMFAFFSGYRAPSNRVKEEIKMFRNTNPKSYKEYLLSQKPVELEQFTPNKGMTSHALKVVKVLAFEGNNLEIYMHHNNGERLKLEFVYASTKVHVLSARRRHLANTGKMVKKRRQFKAAKAAKTLKTAPKVKKAP